MDELALANCTITRNFAPWIAIGLVVIGWVVSHRSANSRERRKEIRNALDRLNSACGQLRADAIEYHTSDSHSDQVARKVKSGITQLSTILPYCRMLGNEKEIAELVSDIRKEITLKNFDNKSNFKKADTSHPRLNKINGQIDLLVARLEKAFSEKFHSRFFDRLRKSI